MQHQKSAFGIASLWVSMGLALALGAVSGCNRAKGEKNKKERSVPVEVQPAATGTLVVPAWYVLIAGTRARMRERRAARHPQGPQANGARPTQPTSS